LLGFVDFSAVITGPVLIGFVLEQVPVDVSLGSDRLDRCVPRVLVLLGEPVEHTAGHLLCDVKEHGSLVEAPTELEGHEHLLVGAMDGDRIRSFNRLDRDSGLIQQRDEARHGARDKDPDQASLAGFADQKIGHARLGQERVERVVE
jgi:hypothetical protein